MRLEGTVSKISKEASAEYFSQRPRGSQIGGWASPQSQPLASREALDALQRDTEARFPVGSVVSMPEFWGGYTLEPVAVEFWQGRKGRLHDRFRYTRVDGRWEGPVRLAP